MKKIVLTVCTAFFVSVSLMCNMQRTEAALTGGVIRLHVRANSDSADDQALKLKVRDRIIADTGEIFANETSIADARDAVGKNLEKIKKSAEDEIRKNGYNYPVRVSFGKSDFPQKIYNDITMPAGTYEALIVEIGSGEGQNWWCVLYPNLCFMDSVRAVVPEEGKEQLKNVLTEEEYDEITEVKIKWFYLQICEGVCRITEVIDW